MTQTLASGSAGTVPSLSADPRPTSGRRPQRLRDRIADPVFTVVTIGMMLLVMALIIYPMYFIVIASVSELDIALGESRCSAGG